MEGTLFIVGGGLNASTDPVFSALIARAGGPQGRFAFIVTASGEDPDDTFRTYEADFERLGVPHGNCFLVPLYAQHVRDERGYNAMTGDADGLCEMMEGVTGVWFTGGDQYFTNRCLIRPDGSDTKLLARLREIYANGGVIGGSSAGAAIMSRVMIGAGSNRGVLTRDVIYGYDDYDELAEEDDPCTPLILAQGLGFFPCGIVDQHFNRRPRLLRSIEACLSNREDVRVAYAVSEDTALVYHAGQIEVLGSAGVYVIDCRRAVRTGSGCYEGVVLHAVHQGDTFDTARFVAVMARENAEEEREFEADYVTGGIIDHPEFDAMIDRELLRGKASCQYQCRRRGLPYVKGAAVYEADGRTFLVILEYFRRPNTRGYRAAHTSFTDVELAVRSVEVAL